MSKYLHREDSPFAPTVWQKIDETVIGAAMSQLSARRILKIEGPYGLGFKMLPLEDTIGGDGDVVTSNFLPLAMIKSEFSLMVRDVAAFEEQNVPLPVDEIAKAAIELARKEDNVLFNGVKSISQGGLLDAAGKNNVKWGDWNNVGVATNDVIKAITALDEAGFHGPYAMAIAPAWYNLLLRRYQQGDQTELEHLRLALAEGVVKAPALKDVAVVIASGSQYASIVVGQDMMTTFVGPEAGSYKFIISETIALRLKQPKAFCLIGK